MAWLEKDTRIHRNHKANSKLRHRDTAQYGPDVISKKQIGCSQKTPSSKDFDPFGVDEFDIIYSINKHKRWEAANKPNIVLIDNQNSIKTSFVSTTVPRESGRDMPVDHLTYDLSNLYRCGGGVNRFISIDNEELIDRKSKRRTANLQSLESNPGPGPLALEKRQMRENEKKRKEVQRRMKKAQKKNMGEDLTENEGFEVEIDPEVRYTAMRLKHHKASSSESVWRKHQNIYRAYNNTLAKQRNSSKKYDDIYDYQDDIDEELQ